MGRNGAERESCRVRVAAGLVGVVGAGAVRARRGGGQSCGGQRGRSKRGLRGPYRDSPRRQVDRGGSDPGWRRGCGYGCATSCVSRFMRISLEMNIRRLSSPAALVLVLALAVSAVAQTRPIAFQGGRILPVEGAPIERGVLIVQEGKILAVGPMGSTPIPAEAEVRDVSGKVLMPGLVDSHSHIGGGSGVGANPPIQA